jgi:SAM-dependent methyltransferase
LLVTLLSLPAARNGIPGVSAGRKTEAIAAIVCQRMAGPIGRFLVVGCGSGEEAAILSRVLGGGGIGIDLKAAFDPAAARAADLRQGDATCLEFQDEEFDFVYSYHVLEHIPEYMKALAEMHRVLKQGGTYLIGTPNRSRLIGYLGSAGVAIRDKLAWNLADWKARMQGRFRNEFGAHAGFTSSELGGALMKVFGGAEEITTPYYLSVYRPYAWLVNLLARSGLGRFLFPAVYFMGTK